MDAFGLGFSIGLVVGSGSFTGHGGQPALRIRLKRRDLDVLETVRRELGGRVFGPYAHEGRSSYVYLLRGGALRGALPILEKHLPSSWRRDQFDAWKAKYTDYFDRPQPSSALLDRMERVLSSGNR
ncbi:MAG TPA: hypothetical protein VJ867_05445 [Gemmatimonadaceae bacterium]|nr:hypothetical protein [Gemmatimonadaceae bacterium]